MIPLDEVLEDHNGLRSSTNGINNGNSNGNSNGIEPILEDLIDDDDDVNKLYPEINKNELTKLIIHTLKDLGYDKSSEQLQKESKLPLESQVISKFNLLIKNGKFDDSIKLIDELILRDDDEFIKIDQMKIKIKFLIYREKFLEELYLNNDPQNLSAVTILRKDINSLANIGTIRSLTSLLMNKNSESLQIKNGWINNSIKSSRSNLLNEILKFISPSSMVPKHRLFELLKQSIQYQKSLNLYQFDDDDDENDDNDDDDDNDENLINDEKSTSTSISNNKLSLYEDLKSSKSNFPDTVIKTLNDHNNEVWFVLFSNDGSKLVTCSADTYIYVYDVNNDFKVLNILKGHNKHVLYACFSPDDTQLLTCSIESKARLWNIETGELIKTFQLETDARLWCCDWFPNGEFIVIGSPDKEINIFNVKTGESINKIKGSNINDLKITSDYKLIVGTYDEKLEIYDLSNNSLLKIKSIEINEKITNISISKQNLNQVLLNLSPNEVQLWDWSKEILLTKYVGHKQEHYMIRSCFGYNEKLICSGSEDGRVFLWNKEFGALLGVFNGHLGICNCVSWNNANKSMFASCGDDSTVKIWGPAKLLL